MYFSNWENNYFLKGEKNQFWLKKTAWSTKNDLTLYFEKKIMLQLSFHSLFTFDFEP